MNNLIAKVLAGVTPRGGSGEGEDAGAKALEAQSGGEGGNFFVNEGGKLLKKKDFEGGFLGEGGEVDGGGGGDEFKMAGDGGATNAGEGTAKDEFESFSRNLWFTEVVLQVVEHGAGDLGGEGPSEVARLGGGFFEGEDQPAFAQTRGGAAGESDEGKSGRDGFFSGHLDFLLR